MLLDYWSQNNTRDCRKSPSRCLAQLTLDSALIAVLFTGLAWFLDTRVPTLDQGISFVAIFTAIGFLLKYLQVEYEEQLGRAAGFTLANKVLGLLLY